ncbi:hypothetical protein [Streptomyces huasconensis]|uniref:hypothetical protein n=1 Tax=Streptomyces huasconensis TaxID=1854574 RepID=UPI0033C79D7C
MARISGASVARVRRRARVRRHRVSRHGPLAPLMADFGSMTEFDRMLDTVLAGIEARAVR